MDISSLLKSLNAQHVLFFVVRASAFPTHGYLRTTADIDIFSKPTRDNARRTLQALAAVGCDTTDLADKRFTPPICLQIAFQQPTEFEFCPAVLSP